MGRALGEDVGRRPDYGVRGAEAHRSGFTRWPLLLPWDIIAAVGHTVQRRVARM